MRPHAAAWAPPGFDVCPLARVQQPQARRGQAARRTNLQRFSEKPRECDRPRAGDRSRWAPLTADHEGYRWKQDVGETIRLGAKLNLGAALSMGLYPEEGRGEW